MSESIVTSAFARAGLLGNPSDGYHGKAIAFSVRQFQATVRLTPNQFVEIVDPAVTHDDHCPNISEFVKRLDRFGYYNSERLIKAAIHRFSQYCEGRFELHTRGFSITCETSIPRSVGLAGSSAIITAVMKALMSYYDVAIRPELLASLVLSVETERLGISAGLMDRVIQSLEGMVFMDFSTDAMQDLAGISYGNYQQLTGQSIGEHLYVAWAAHAAEPTEVLHNRLRERYQSGDQDVVAAMSQFARLAERGKHAIESGDIATLNELIDANFDLRASICQLPALHQQMVRLARESGLSAKFCGSGGAIVGVAPDQASYDRAGRALAEIGCQMIRPVIWPED